MEEFDRIEQQLRSASDGVQRLDPGDGGGIEVARTLARHRANRRRALASVTAIAVVVGGVAAATQVTDDDDSTPLATTGVTTKHVKASTTTTAPVQKTTSSTVAKTTTTGAVKPAVTPEKTTTSTSEVPKTTVPPPPKSTTTTAVKTGSRPPAAYVGTKEGGKVKADEGSSCWKGAEDQAALCADVAAGWADDAPILQISTNALVYAWWDTKDIPKAHKGYLHVRKDGVTDAGSQEVVCEGTNPCKMSLTLAPGEYVLILSSYWTQGDVTHGVRLSVS